MRTDEQIINKIIFHQCANGVESNECKTGVGVVLRGTLPNYSGLHVFRVRVHWVFFISIVLFFSILLIVAR